MLKIRKRDNDKAICIPIDIENVIVHDNDD